jgi:hypothetical protein
MSYPLKTTVRPVIMLNGEFSTWTKIYDSTPPSGERECPAFWWSIHREPWKPYRRRSPPDGHAGRRSNGAMRRWCRQ